MHSLLKLKTHVKLACMSYPVYSLSRLFTLATNAKYVW